MNQINPHLYVNLHEEVLSIDNRVKCPLKSMSLVCTPTAREILVIVLKEEV